ncbi:MAG TPA: PqqD family protein [Terracidiphilus sp.]|nr:PqqD family protein [Terracidiphilus sp.]
MEKIFMKTPCARKDKVLSTKLLEETMVYDQVSHRAHVLNRTVALVWGSANGRNSIDEIAQILHRELGLPADRDIVLLALKELSESGLLQEPVQAETGPERLTRRQVAQKLTLAGASLALVPLVTSVLAPTPAMAQSSVTQAQAEQDLIKVIEEAGSNLGSNTTAQNELANAAAAYSKGDYNSELADLEGVLDTLGLPPL